MSEKGIPHNLEFIDIASGQNYEPWFVKINPACEVPVLCHGQTVVADSKKINDYLEEHFTSSNGFKSLMPAKDTIEYERAESLRAEIDRLNIEVVSYGIFFHKELSKNVKVPDAMKNAFRGRSEMRKKTIAKQAAKNPDLAGFYKEKMKKVVEAEKQIHDDEALEARLKEIDALMDTLEEQLKSNASETDRRNWWLCSKDFSLADVSLGILLARLYLLGLGQRYWSIASRPYLAIYYQRLNERPAFKKVAVSHITTADLLQIGLGGMVQEHGLTVAGVVTAIGVLIAGAFILARKKK